MKRWVVALVAAVAVGSATLSAPVASAAAPPAAPANAGLSGFLVTVSGRSASVAWTTSGLQAGDRVRLDTGLPYWTAWEQSASDGASGFQLPADAAGSLTATLSLVRNGSVVGSSTSTYSAGSPAASLTSKVEGSAVVLSWVLPGATEVRVDSGLPYWQPWRQTGSGSRYDVSSIGAGTYTARVTGFRNGTETGSASAEVTIGGGSTGQPSLSVVRNGETLTIEWSFPQADAVEIDTRFPAWQPWRQPGRSGRAVLDLRQVPGTESGQYYITVSPVRAGELAPDSERLTRSFDLPLADSLPTNVTITPLSLEPGNRCRAVRLSSTAPLRPGGFSALNVQLERSDRLGSGAVSFGTVAPGANSIVLPRPDVPVQQVGVRFVIMKYDGATSAALVSSDSQVTSFDVPLCLPDPYECSVFVVSARSISCRTPFQKFPGGRPQPVPATRTGVVLYQDGVLVQNASRPGPTPPLPPLEPNRRYRICFWTENAVGSSGSCTQDSEFRDFSTTLAPASEVYVFNGALVAKLRDGGSWDPNWGLLGGTPFALEDCRLTITGEGSSRSATFSNVRGEAFASLDVSTSGRYLWQADCKWDGDSRSVVASGRFDEGVFSRT
jgi:hypothetical protein